MGGSVNRPAARRCAGYHTAVSTGIRAGKSGQDAHFDTVRGLERLHAHTNPGFEHKVHATLLAASLTNAH